MSSEIPFEPVNRPYAPMFDLPTTRGSISTSSSVTASSSDFGSTMDGSSNTRRLWQSSSLMGTSQRMLLKLDKKQSLDWYYTSVHEHVTSTVSDIEKFLAAVYNYYRGGGFYGILGYTIGNLLAVLFTITFAFTLCFLIDWSSLLSCTSPETCVNAHLFKSNPLAGLGLIKFVLLLSFLGTLTFWGLAAAGAFMTVKEARDAAFYYQDYLGIPLDSETVSFSPLQAVSWAEVARRLVRLQNGATRGDETVMEGRQMWCMLQARISIVEMTNLLMRDSSYALLLQGEESPLLSMIPPWVSLPSHFVASNAVNWVIKTLIMPCLIDEHSKQLFPEITTEEFARRLRKRLRLWGLVAFVTLIPVLMMSFLFTWLKYTDDFRSARASPLQREWTNVAKFHTREFLELPHLHRSRLNSALLPRGGGSVTETFVNMSWGTTPIQGATKRLIKYVCGSIAATLFALALWDDSPLLHVVFAGKNLLWYLAVSGTLVSLVSRSTDDGERGQTADATSASTPLRTTTSSPRESPTGGKRREIGSSGEGVGMMSSVSATPLNAWVATMRLLQTIHYLPQMSQIVQGEELNESNSACRFDFLYNFERCKASFLSVFYVDRIRIILFELYSIILCPFLLSVWLPGSVETLVRFVVENSYEHPSFGHWCVYGSLDESISLGEFEMSEIDSTLSSGEMRLINLPKPRVAKAIISFALTYIKLSENGVVSEADLIEIGLPKAAKLLADIEEFQDGVLKNSLTHSEDFHYYDSSSSSESHEGVNDGDRGCRPRSGTDIVSLMGDCRPLHEQLLVCMAEEELHGMEQQARRERLIRSYIYWYEIACASRMASRDEISPVLFHQLFFHALLKSER